MGNYVIAVGNYVIDSPSGLGNYMIADMRARLDDLRRPEQVILLGTA